MQIKKTLLILSLYFLAFNSIFSQQERFIASLQCYDALVNEYIHKQGIEILNHYENNMIDVLVNSDQFKTLQDNNLKPTVRTTENQLKNNLHEGLRLDGYRSYDEILILLQGWVNDYPEICTLYDIGNSLGKAYFEAGYPAYTDYQHDIWAVKISDNPNVDEDEPSLLFDAAHHARETISVSVALNFAGHVLENYDQDPLITEAVNNNQIWVVPLVNPDGYKIVIDSLEVWWRKTIRDNNNNHQIDPFLPQWIEPDGVDPNRNYGIYWGGDWNSAPTFRETYRGPHSFSEPCIQALDSLMGAEHFVAELSYHSYGELFIYPWAYNNVNHLTPDHLMYQTLANQLAGMTPKLSGGNYTSICVGSFNMSTGTTTDYAYGRFGTISFTVELAQDFIPPPEDIIPVCEANLNSQLYLLERVHRSVLTGHVKDALTTEPLVAKVFVEEIDGNPNGRFDICSDEDFGRFYRLLNPNDYTVTFSAFGYESQTFTGVTVTEDSQTNLEVFLDEAEPFELSGMVIDQDGFAIQNAQIIILNTPVDTLWSGEFGNFYTGDFYDGNYDIKVSAQDHFTQIENHEINQSQNVLLFELEYYDLIDFEDEGVLVHFNMNGHQNWSRTDEQSFSGEYSLVSPVLGSTQNASASVYLYLDSDVLMSVATKVSVDSVTQGMIFCMDEQIMKTYTWIENWVLDTFYIPKGNHQFRWSVSRSYTNPGSQYENKCWIDEILFTGLPTSMEELGVEPETLCQVFPNPSKGPFYIMLDADIKTLFFAGVYDMTGKEMKILISSSTPNYQLMWDGNNVSGWPVPQGIYMIKLVTDQGIISKKLLKK